MNSDSEDSVTGDLQDHELTGLDLVLSKFKIYLDDATQHKEAEIKEKLQELGVSSLTDLKYLNIENDFKGLFKPIQCRKLQEDIAQDFKADKVRKFEKIHYAVPLHLFSQRKLDVLTSNHMENSDRLKIVNIVAGDLFDNIKGGTTKADCDRAAKAMCDRYAVLAGKQYGKGHECFSMQLQNHIHYLKSLERRKMNGQRKNVSRRGRRSLKDCYGTHKDRYLPEVLPKDETPITQKEKKQELQLQSKLAQPNWHSVRKLMVETYATQRVAIVEDKLNMEAMLQEWPFIGKFEYLKDHFYYLMDISEDDCEKRLRSLLPKMVRFMRSQAEERRKGKAAELTKKLVQVIKKIDTVDKEHPENENAYLPAVIMCLVVCMSQEEKRLFLHFEETTSFDEIQASAQLPSDGKPIIAVLGEDVTLPGCKCFVAVESRILFKDSLDSSTALLALFMAYFVFGIQYPLEIAAVLEFMQRSIFKVEDGEKSKAERKRKRHQINGIASKYQTLMKKFDSFCAKWDL